ncbi:putative portal protein [Acinetobacter phage Ab65]|nr:putative portal protein [Acinetobacter phage Ab31]WMC00519.1 putative portal protein [Acinetobacter phage Ab59]WMC00637.1 putative portal protein [Acinetobacter phage Ab65]
MFDWLKKKEEAPKRKPKWNALLNAMQAHNEGVAIQYKAPSLPDGVAPDGHSAMAMDGFCTASQYAGLEPQFYSNFLGYQVLAQLAQSTEYRLVAETFAQEMTREWGEVKGDDQKRVDILMEEFNRLDIRNLIRKHIENDYYYGGSQLYIQIEGQEDKTDLPLLINEKGVKKGSLKGFTVIEPLWSTPSMYNANNPLESDFFVPKQWWVMGKNVHHSRLLTLIMRPVGQMLKPAYNFYGMSMSQLMLPYVQRHQSIVDAVAKLITMFSLTGIKTDMSAILQGDEGGANQLISRLKTLALGRDNQGVVALDGESEEFFQINTPLSGLDTLLDKFTQMLAYPSKIPVLKIFGTPTAGLGNTSDGEIRVFYDCVSAQQEAYILPQIKVILDCMQLSLFGNIDESIKFVFNPLYQLDDNEQADVNLKKAQTAQIYIQEGVIDNEEARQALNDDEDSGYQLEGNAPERDPYAENENIDIVEK